MRRENNESVLTDPKHLCKPVAKPSLLHHKESVAMHVDTVSETRENREQRNLPIEESIPQMPFQEREGCLTIYSLNICIDARSRIMQGKPKVYMS